MTNAEKYLKDGADVAEFANGFYNAYLDLYDEDNLTICMLRWLAEENKPTLTEDERVILRNIDKDNYKGIGRKKGTLYLVSATPNYFGGENDKEVFWYCFHELFQFIKERRRI